MGLQRWNNAHRRAILRPILVDGDSPPLGGNCCFTVGYLGYRAITTNLALRPPLSHTHCSHTPLSHTLFSHYDHCSHTMTTKWHEGSASGTSPRSPELEPTQSQGAPWQQGGWAQAHRQGCREGGGAAKKTTIERGVQEKAGCAHGSGPLSNMTLQGTGSQSNRPV